MAEFNCEQSAQISHNAFESKGNNHEQLESKNSTQVLIDEKQDDFNCCINQEDTIDQQSTTARKKLNENLNSNIAKGKQSPGLELTKPSIIIDNIDVDVESQFMATSERSNLNEVHVDTNNLTRKTESEFDKRSSNRNNNNNDNDDDDDQEFDLSSETRVYKRRFLILALFCAYSATNSFQWIQYSSITNIITSYYGATNMQVNLTSLIYMITYIPFIIHASLMLERVGLRYAILIGTTGTALGAFIKWWLGGEPTMDSFWCLMFGQTVTALSQLYVLSIPPLLAAVWFPDNQVSTATGIGVFGNQLGIALGFIVPPMFISSNIFDSINNVEELNENANTTRQVYDANSNMRAQIGTDLNCLARIVFCSAALICVISLILFEDKPKKPPGSASLQVAKKQRQRLKRKAKTINDSSISSNTQLQQDARLATNSATISIDGYNVDAQNDEASLSAILSLCKDKDFCFLILSYGINTGCFYAVSTILNQMVAIRFPSLVQLAGTMGLLLVISGMAGSLLCGHVLDKTHAYKIIIVLVYLFSVLSMLLFAISLQLFSTTWPLCIAASILGFFMTGYLPLGYEFAAEITYPHPPNSPAGLLNLSAQIFGFVLTYVSSPIVDLYGNLWVNTFFIVCLTIGFVLTALMKADLKRQKAIAGQVAAA